MRLAGIDLAWHGDSKPSAIATGILNDNQIVLDALDPAVVGLDSISDFLTGLESLEGIAIDAPLIIKIKTGQRPCETEVGTEYGARGASCHATNLTLYPDAFSVRLSETLSAIGFHHLGSEKWQIECYPHPAIIEIFGIDYRLKYKKGNVAEKKEGQKILASYLLQLFKSKTLKLTIPDKFQQPFQPDHIDSLGGESLKSNEDALDAVVCLYIAASYAKKTTHQIFGDTQHGYIWVPTGKRI